MTNETWDDHGRREPPPVANEADTLIGFLDFQRATLAWRCRGLSDDDLRVARAPSTVTLGGLLKHLAFVEDFWFTEVVAGRPLPEPWASADFETDRDWEWHSAARDSGDGLRALWSECVERSRATVLECLGRADALSTSHPRPRSDEQFSLRWVLTHMIEEYARHNGHADLLREAIDGETGE